MPLEAPSAMCSLVSRLRGAVYLAVADYNNQQLVSYIREQETQINVISLPFTNQLGDHGGSHWA